MENASDKISNNSNRNYVGTYNDSLEVINQKWKKGIKIKKNCSSLSNYNKKVSSYGNIKLVTQNNSYYLNDIIKLKNAKKK